jgi:hypothetical protein
MCAPLTWVYAVQRYAFPSAKLLLSWAAAFLACPRHDSFQPHVSGFSAAATTMLLSIMYILLWLPEMGLAGAAAGVCAGADLDAWASTAPGTAAKTINRKYSLVVTWNAPPE